MKKEIKKEIMSCLTSMINELAYLIEFVVDLKEEQNSDDEGIYAKRIVELQNENKSTKEKCENLRLGNVTMFNKLADNDKLMDKYQYEIKELYTKLEEPVPIFLSENKEMQELKLKLAESERAAEYSNDLWNSFCKKLTKENEKLEKELLFREVR